MATFIRSLLRLTRFGNLFIITLTQYFTALFFIGINVVTDPKLLLLITSTVLIAAAGYIINDYYDIKIDYINKPERVVIGKIISRRLAILLHTFFSISATIIEFFISWQVAVIHFLSAFFLWWYSNTLKRLPFIGNFVISVLTGLSVYIVTVVYGVNNVLIGIYALFAFSMTLIREVIKDIEDLKGDTTFGCRTLPIVWGIRKTKLFLCGVMLLFCVIVWLLDSVYTSLPSVYFLGFLFLPLLWMVFRLYRADTVNDFKWLSSFCKLIMLLGILSMTFL